MLEEKYGWKHISVGELFRRHIKNKTDIGQKAEKFVLNGEWVPAELTFKMIRPELEKLTNVGFILDGFPRLPEQIDVFERFLEKSQYNLDLAIHIDIRPEVIMERRQKAWQKGKSFYDQKRKDETKEAIESRINEYLSTIGPILDFYQQKGILYRVDGERPIDEIHRDIVDKIETIR